MIRQLIFGSLLLHWNDEQQLLSFDDSAQHPPASESL